jgi:hypothetical protein
LKLMFYQIINDQDMGRCIICGSSRFKKPYRSGHYTWERSCGDSVKQAEAEHPEFYGSGAGRGMRSLMGGAGGAGGIPGFGFPGMGMPPPGGGGIPKCHLEWT